MDPKDRDVTPGPWKDRADFERWWAAHVVAFTFTVERRNIDAKAEGPR